MTNNVERGYGWTIPAGAVAALVIVSLCQNSNKCNSTVVCVSLTSDCDNAGDSCPCALLPKDSADHSNIPHALRGNITLPGMPLRLRKNLMQWHLCSPACIPISFLVHSVIDRLSPAFLWCSWCYWWQYLPATGQIPLRLAVQPSPLSYTSPPSSNSSGF